MCLFTAPSLPDLLKKSARKLMVFYGDKQPRETP
jgi:hypothetical protein